MNRKSGWMQQNSGAIQMSICILFVVLISINYYHTISQNIRIAVLAFLAVILCDALAIYARTRLKKIPIYSILVMYILSMATLFVANISGIYVSELGTWITFLISAAYFFILAFDYEYSRKERLKSPE